ncbi:hypothetical protein [Burkholderia catarinensis]|uniref:hypothetical protein n=1 Tax=Burkholderia catarinensis TaxID=1108140 RepID=UPI00100839C2|nr:hypothetical protein [Burkholderia catarinensis]
MTDLEANALCGLGCSGRGRLRSGMKRMTLSAICALHQFGLVMHHHEEAVELSLNAGPVAADRPADQCGEVQLAAPAEMPRIVNMTRTQFRRMKVADEPPQYMDNPS